MNKDENNKDMGISSEPATLAGPVGFEEELKDYSKSDDEGPVNNLPDSHPEPSPTQNPKS